MFSFQGQSRIAFTGQGKVLYVADLGYIQVHVSSEAWTELEAEPKNQARTELAARQKNEARIKMIFEALKELGIQEKDIKMSNVKVQTRHEFGLHSGISDKGVNLVIYTTSVDLTVTVRKLPRIGETATRMLGTGAIRNMQVAYGSSNLDQLMAQARAKAVADARGKASLLLLGPGARLGDVLAITDVPPHHQLRFLPVDVCAGKVSLPIAPGEQEVSVNVAVRWSIDSLPIWRRGCVPPPSLPPVQRGNPPPVRKIELFPLSLDRA